jgi:hypothetical protein
VSSQLTSGRYRRSRNAYARAVRVYPYPTRTRGSGTGRVHSLRVRVGCGYSLMGTGTTGVSVLLANLAGCCICLNKFRCDAVNKTYLLTNITNTNSQSYQLLREASSQFQPHRIEARGRSVQLATSSQTCVRRLTQNTLMIYCC